MDVRTSGRFISLGSVTVPAAQVLAVLSGVSVGIPGIRILCDRDVFVPHLDVAAHAELVDAVRAAALAAGAPLALIGPFLVRASAVTSFEHLGAAQSDEASAPFRHQFRIFVGTYTLDVAVASRDTDPVFATDVLAFSLA